MRSEGGTKRRNKPCMRLARGSHWTRSDLVTKGMLRVLWVSREWLLGGVTAVTFLRGMQTVRDKSSMRRVPRY